MGKYTISTLLSHSRLRRICAVRFASFKSPFISTYVNSSSYDECAYSWTYFSICFASPRLIRGTGARSPFIIAFPIFSLSPRASYVRTYVATFPLSAKASKSIARGGSSLGRGREREREAEIYVAKTIGREKEEEKKWLVMGFSRLRRERGGSSVPSRTLFLC